ncbi:ABC transporter ATP-binding protein [Nonomuraea endophytica]|uniref:ABC-type multidrug transport system fused ATPase/permease subunit n=1 Tax=Nonomuraea endophytica TaxID=714136 RepID=A0A7W8ADP5_9ACTN|nr:ABC transporter ATP-binding protein [Nonomuraea endophytica]MBB5084193.1 ABC-type multidrug transport system fused ATPase/permease subunit [Nonomuraea endophytica]
MRRRGAATARGSAAALPSLATAWWDAHTAALAGTSFLRIAARLPATTARAVTVAWRADRRDTAFALALSMLGGVATSYGLLATRDVLVALFAAGPTLGRVQAALPSLVVVAAAVAARSGLSIGAGWAQARLMPKVLTLVERELFELTTRVELAAFDDPGFSDEMKRARNRGGMALQALVRGTLDLVAGLAGLAGTAVALLVVHPLLLAALVLASLPGAWAAVRVARLSYVSERNRTSRRRRMWMLGELMAERLTAAEVRVFTMRDFLLREYDRMVSAETDAELEVVAGQTRVRVLGGLLSGAATAGLYTVLGMLLIGGGLPLAAAATAVLALQAARQSLTLALTNVNKIYEEGLYYGDFTEFAERCESRLPPPADTAVITPPETIEVKQAELSYGEDGPMALDGVSLTARRGQTIALVGENGSGKTSLAMLLAGLRRPTSGAVTWDGLPLDAVERHELWRHVGLVSQEFWRWPFTAARNITLGTEHEDRARMRAAAAKAGAHQVIEKLPEGYDTLLSRVFAGGQDLSGGQWQRLTCARAFYRDAPLLICDEPSAALDPKAEHALFASLRAGAERRITVLITHRLANVRHADRIYVLHHGRVVEEGTHGHLMALDGRYAELFTLQADGYLEERIA